MDLVLVPSVAETSMIEQTTFSCIQKLPLDFLKISLEEKKKITNKSKALSRVETRAYCYENAGYIIWFFINVFGINYNYHCVHNVPYTRSLRQYYLLVKVKL